MHYRNGREAKNGDKIVQIGGYGSGAQIVAVGVLHDARPGNDHGICPCCSVEEKAKYAARRLNFKFSPGAEVSLETLKSQGALIPPVVGGGACPARTKAGAGRSHHCNGGIAPIHTSVQSACLCDCLHVDDLAAILKEKGLDKRPVGL